MWGRASAGIVPGFLLATALTGLICWLPPGPWQHWLMPGVVLFFPLWTGLACTAFVFRNGRRAWAWYSGFAMAALGLLWSLQALHWIA